MSLNLGLESLGITQVTEADVMAAEISSLESLMSFERALFDVSTMMHNVHNYNEIIKSLKKHSSAECMAFATDLLGFTPSMEEDAPQAEGGEATPAEAAAPEEGKWQRFKGALAEAWQKFKDFCNTCWNWVKDQIGKLKAALKIAEAGHMYVRFANEDLDKIIKAYGDMKGGGSNDKAFADLNAIAEAIAKNGKRDIDIQGNSGIEYLGKLMTAQKALVSLMNAAKWSNAIKGGDAEALKVVAKMLKVNPKLQKIIRSEIDKISSYVNKSTKKHAKNMASYNKKVAKAQEKGKEAPEEPAVP